MWHFITVKWYRMWFPSEWPLIFLSIQRIISKNRWVLDIFSCFLSPSVIQFNSLTYGLYFTSFGIIFLSLVLIIFARHTMLFAPFSDTKLCDQLSLPRCVWNTINLGSIWKELSYYQKLPVLLAGPAKLFLPLTALSGMSDLRLVDSLNLLCACLVYKTRWNLMWNLPPLSSLSQPKGKENCFFRCSASKFTVGGRASESCIFLFFFWKFLTETH